ncbi:hypothetical protein niasHT_010691 [Heterodera trifolii]|uniref:Effector protein n=1 Tax=Heterodera trifolii TaxID=157864 RepID=A0ABD2LA04_9BILA
MIYQFSSNFLFLTIFGLVIIIETLLCPTVEASETVTIKAYCTGNASYPLPVYDTVNIRLKDCETIGYVKKEVQCEKKGISYAFIFEREQNHPTVVRTEMTPDGRNIHCVDYEDEEDSEMEHRLSTFYEAKNEWAKEYEIMSRDKNELENTEMTSQSMRDQIFKHPLFIKTRNARIALYSYIGYKERQKTLEIKAYCTGHRSNPVPVYADAQRRLDACKQSGNVYWDELLASILRSYHNAKKELEKHEQSYMNNMGKTKYLNYHKKLEESAITNAEGIDQIIIQLQKQLKEDKSMFEEALVLIPKKNNEWESYYNNKKQELAIKKKNLEYGKLDIQMKKKLKIDSEKHAEKGGEEISENGREMGLGCVDHGEAKELRQRKGKSVIVSAPSQQ